MHNSHHLWEQWGPWWFTYYKLNRSHMNLNGHWYKHWISSSITIIMIKYMTNTGNLSSLANAFNDDLRWFNLSMKKTWQMTVLSVHDAADVFHVLFFWHQTQSCSGLIYSICPCGQISYLEVLNVPPPSPDRPQVQ